MRLIGVLNFFINQQKGEMQHCEMILESNFSNINRTENKSPLVIVWSDLELAEQFFNSKRSEKTFICCLLVSVYSPVIWLLNLQ